MADLAAIQLPPIPTLKGPSNLGHWNDVLFTTLRLHHLEDIIFRHYPNTTNLEPDVIRQLELKVEEYESRMITEDLFTELFPGKTEENLEYIRMELEDCIAKYIPEEWLRKQRMATLMIKGSLGTIRPHLLAVG